MMLDLDIDIAEGLEGVPEQADFERWLKLALSKVRPEKEAEISLMVVSEAVSRELNHQYRGKDRPTNVLSFPADIPAYVESHLLGDLVICAPVVEREAQEQNKPLDHHWAHLTIHGCLHLLGYDHINEADAQVMEQLEIELLAELNIPNPYEIKE
jgi:probable rRNA maturation factor